MFVLQNLVLYILQYLSAMQEIPRPAIVGVFLKGKMV